MTGFIQFIRTQGVMGLAIGFILGGSVGKVVTSLVNDIVQPAIGLAFGSVDGLASLHVGPILNSNFMVAKIDVLNVAAVVDVGCKMLRLDRLDLRKEEARVLQKKEPPHSA